MELCLETHFKALHLDGSIWKQVDGCLIGKSISGEIAEIYMDWFEKQYVFNEENTFKPRVWKRMRDDVFIIWRTISVTEIEQQEEDELGKFVQDINKVEPRIKFTVEREREKKLPFLDIDIERLDDRLKTKVYRKETHTQRYLEWRSNHSKACKLGVLKGLIHRAHLLCDEKEDLEEELAILRDVFIANGYPKGLVIKTIKQSWAV